MIYNIYIYIYIYIYMKIKYPEALAKGRPGRLGARPGRRRLAAAGHFVYLVQLVYLFFFTSPLRCTRCWSQSS